MFKMFSSKTDEFIGRNIHCPRELYKAMDKGDTCEVVMAAYDILKNKLRIPCLLKKTFKSEELSNLLRTQSNKCFGLGQYDAAFEGYNMALLFAPKDSRALKLAYSNKSALFHKIKRYQECINDIDKCFSLNCPEDLVNKLKNRKEDAIRLLQPKVTHSEDEYLEFKALLNQTPYIDKHMDIIRECNATKVVATRDIELGTVVAIEPAFASNVIDCRYGCCYYCQKFALNLVPCDDCCFVLFCSDECKDLCMKEYHKIECDIMDILTTSDVSENLMFKSVIKLVLSGTWEELIEISKNIEVENVQFDVHSRFSVLNLRDNKLFKFGQMYNVSFVCAALIRHLETIPHIFPESPVERLHAIRALGKIMMFIVLNCKPHLIVQAAKNLKRDTVLYRVCDGIYGLYPLVENFKKSCENNVTTAFVKNKMVLIAIKPIKSGSEMTLPYMAHDNKIDLGQKFKYFHTLKNNGDICKKCADNTHTQKSQVPYLSSHQQEIFVRSLSLVVDDIGKNYVLTILCEALTLLSDVDQSDEYKKIYEVFINFIQLYLLRESENMYI
ncbi:SET and MYND domain-containing protein 4-like isoform X2 [Epargyreus clarus]|uniref:SET and MYND domain-containing protein 4-like isoform X2 n=1 Tax=Epargyreus clarus TaxID=520877 RepID=UPI003C2F5D7D